MKRSTYIWSLLVGCVAFATSCDLTENVQVKADKSMIFGSKSGLELYSNSFYKALPTLKNGFMQDKMCDVGAVSNTDTFIKQGAYNTETATSWSWGALKNVNYFIDGCNDPKYCTVEAETRDNYLGIARWFRAWFYYDKLTTYGEVPWFPNDIQSYQNDVMYKDRDSRDVIIRNLIADLDFAYEHIQATSSTGSATLTRWAAAALKSRVCLFEAAYRRYHNLTGLEITPEELYREAAKAAKLVIDNSGCSLNTAAGKKGAYRDLFYSETPLTQEVILAVCANEKSGIFGEQNWWFNARSYGLCWSLVRSFVHTYLKQDGTPFTAAADYAVKSFAEEMEGRDLRLEQTVRGRNFLWDGKTAVADIKNLSLTGYQVIKYTLDESKYDGGAKNINSIPLIRYAEVLLNYAEAQAELGVLTDSEWALTVGALRKRAGITGGTETLPTTVDSYLQRTFYPDVTSPVLLEIRRERAIELVAEGMRFDDLRRWKCGSLMETLRWSGIHIPGLEQPVDVNGDGVNDYYFTEGEVVSAPAAYKNIAVRVNQDGVSRVGLRSGLQDRCGRPLLVSRRAPVPLSDSRQGDPRLQERGLYDLAEPRVGQRINKKQDHENIPLFTDVFVEFRLRFRRRVQRSEARLLGILQTPARRRTGGAGQSRT